MPTDGPRRAYLEYIEVKNEFVCSSLSPLGVRCRIDNNIGARPLSKHPSSLLLQRVETIYVVTASYSAALYRKYTKLLQYLGPERVVIHKKRRIYAVRID